MSEPSPLDVLRDILNMAHPVTGADHDSVDAGPAALAQVAALVEAARVRSQTGCDDTCASFDWTPGDPAPCDCGQMVLAAALAPFQVPEEQDRKEQP